MFGKIAHAVLSIFPSTQPAACLSAIYWLGTLALFVFGWRYFRHRYRTSWYDNCKSGYLGSVDWRSVKELLMKDPLDFQPKLRLINRKNLFDLATFAFGISMWSVISCVVFHSVSGLKHGAATEDQLRIPTFLFGFGTLIATLLGISIQLRLKARSENRQKWLEQIRAVLAELIASMPSPADSKEIIQKKRDEFLPRHATLELLLNPSETVHRTLLALIRHAYCPDGFAIDDQVQKQIGQEVFCIVFERDEDHKQYLINLKSQIIRLSNVTLKREWEQVKHAQ